MPWRWRSRLSRLKSSCSPSIARVPRSGISSPAISLSSVVFPPPDGPIIASAWKSAIVSVIPCRAAWLPYHFSRPRSSSRITILPFQCPAHQGDGECQHEIPRRQGEVTLQSTVGEGIHLLGIEGEFADSDDGEERRILDDGGELAGQRRQQPAQDLRKDNVAIGLPAGEADGP